MTKFVAFLMLSLAASATAQEFGKYQLPNGSFYFGNNPPAGAVRIGGVTSDVVRSKPDAPTESEAADRKNDARSNAMLVDQRKLEHELERAREDLREVRNEISDAQNVNTTPTGRYRNWQAYVYDREANSNAKYSRLTELHDRESEHLHRISQLEGDLAKVRATRAELQRR